MEVSIVDYEKNREGFLKISERLLATRDEMKVFDRNEMEEIIRKLLEQSTSIDRYFMENLKKELNERGLEIFSFNERKPIDELIENETFSKEEIDKLMQKNVMLNELIEISPQDPNLYMKRGKFYLEECEFYDKAIDDFSIAIELYPNNSYAHHYRAIAYYKSDLKSQAFQDFTTVTQIELYDTSIIQEANNYLSLLTDSRQRYPKLEDNKL